MVNKLKITVNMLGTSKLTDRLKVLEAGAIHSNNHEVKINILAEGLRPDFIPASWNWIPLDHIHMAHRHIYAIKNGIACSKCDYNIFCDDDVIIDIDKFCDLAQNENAQPTIWTPHPGSNLEPRWQNKIRECFNAYSTDLNQIWVGWTTSVVNNHFMSVCLSKPELLDSIMCVSEEIAKHAFYADNQIPILSFFVKAKHVKGMESGATGWPSFLDSSVLLNTGRLWHIHHTGENPFFKSKALQDVLRKGRYDKKEKLVDDLFTSLNKGFKAKDLIGNTFDIGWFWCPWTGKHNPHHSHLNIIENIKFTDGGKCELSVNRYNSNMNLTWEPYENGLQIHLSNMMKLEFKWRMDGNFVGYPTGKADCFGSMFWIKPKG